MVQWNEHWQQQKKKKKWEMKQKTVGQKQVIEENKMARDILVVGSIK